MENKIKAKIIKQKSKSHPAWSEIEIGDLRIHSNTSTAIELMQLAVQTLKQKVVKQHLQMLEESRRNPTPSYIG